MEREILRKNKGKIENIYYVFDFKFIEKSWIDRNMEY